MLLAELLLMVSMAIPLSIAGGWLGWRYQRYIWKMHLPYEERVRHLGGCRS